MNDRYTEEWLANYQTKRGLRLEIVSAQPKPNKYRARRTEVDGIVFDSKRESTRYQDLKAMQDLGLIHDLKLQVPYTFVHDGVKIGKYIADFTYLTAEGEFVVEDVKSDATRRLALYRWKKKMMAAFFHLEVREV